MNHIADANKMVETPRMNSVAGHARGIVDAAIFAEGMKLERELNAANERIKSLIEERDRANRLAEWKWNLRDEFQLLLGTDKIEEGIEAVKELKRRIKRLEEAGDGLMKSINCGCPYGPSVFNCQTCTNSWDAWRKAKEAKL